MYKLMIAEDEVLEREALKLIIKKNFNNLSIIGEAYDGEMAIHLAKKMRPDIILMDIKMPVIDGLEAQKNICEFLPNVKTIILTAYDDFKYAQLGVKLHAFDYLLKPAKPSDIIESLKKLILSINNNSDYMQKLPAVDKEDSIIDKALKYIKSNYSEDINLENIASYVHLNPQYFSRYFKSKVGMNFIDYLSKVRINAAIFLLMNTEDNINCISLKIGYIDAAYFSKVFLKFVGVSPHRFRLENKNDFLNNSVENKFLIKF